MKVQSRSRVVSGILLIVLGLGLFGLQYVEPLSQSAILLLLGGLFVAAYLYGRSYLLLVFGGILLGLGAGSYGQRYLYVWGEFSRIGLGAGFVAIYLIALLRERRSHFWPLIPGAILILLGFGKWHRVWTFLFSDGWPLIFVIIGVMVLLGLLGRSGKKAPDPTD